MVEHSITISEGFVKLAQFCNRFNFPGSSKRFCIPFVVGGRQVGLIRPDVAGYLRDYPEVFLMEPNSVTGEVERVELAHSLATFTDRTNKMAEVLQALRKKDVFSTLDGWRNECYDVKARFAEPALFKLERAAACLFGVTQYGVHVNGYTYQRGEGLHMWLGKRSATKPTFPGQLDQMVAGGLASGLTVMECAWKECQEEASVPDALLRKLKPAGCISYFYEDERGLFPENQFVMDLELPEDFTPVNADGETESFQLVSVAQVRLPWEEMVKLNKGSIFIITETQFAIQSQLKRLIIGENFKFNCAMCVLEFLFRHSQILPDEEPNYTHLLELMHTSIAWK